MENGLGENILRCCVFSEIKAVFLVPGKGVNLTFVQNFSDKLGHFTDAARKMCLKLHFG